MPDRYIAYGLTFESDLDFPELPQDTSVPAAPDVVIRLGEVAERLDAAQGRGVLYEASENEFLLTMPDIARYLVTGGDTITVQPFDGADPNDVRVFMLGSCFGALLHQRQMLVLHAAAMATEHGAVLFAGNSGAGKSTLLNEMMSRGHKMMVDDVCGVVAAADGVGVDVLSGYPRTRLWADSAEKLDIDTAGLDRTRKSMEKFERQVPEGFHAEHLPFHRLYVLGSRNEDGIEIRTLPAMQAFNVILRNTYRRQFLDGLATTKPHFALASAAAASATVSRVLRPSGKFTLRDLADHIEADVFEMTDTAATES